MSGISAKIASVISALVIASTIAVAGAITAAGSELLMDAAVKRLGHSAQIAGMRLSALIKAVSQDTQFLTHTKAVARIIQAQGEDERGIGGPGWKDDLADIFSAMLESQPWYHQIRLLDMQKQPREVVRVQRVHDQIKRMPAHRAPEEPLRRYFEASAGLAGNGFYLSEIDLHREHGRLGAPRTPSVSAARPVYAETGTPFGLIVIDVDMGPVFEATRSLLDPESSLYVTNEQGDYVFHPDATGTFGLDLEQPHRIQDEIPETRPLLEGSLPQLVVPRLRAGSAVNSVGYFERVPLAVDGTERFLVLGVSTPRDSVLEHVDEIRKRGAGYTFLFVLFAVVLAILATRLLTKPLRQLAQGVDRLVRGQKHETVLPVERNDEIGELARAIQFLANKLNSARANPRR